MTVEQIKKNKHLRMAVHLSSLGYLLMLGIMVINQVSFFESIIQKYFRLKIGSILRFFSSDNWVDNLTINLQLMATDMIILVVIELVLVVTGLSIIFYLLWRLKKKQSWRLSEKIVTVGYLFLVGSLMVILTKMTLTSYQTYEVINSRLSSLSVEEVKEIQYTLQEIVLKSNLNLDSFIPNALGLVEQLKEFVNKTSAIAGIPKLLDSSWQTLLVLKTWLVGCSVMAIVIILVGHLIEGVAHLNVYQQLRERMTRTKASRQIELNERLVEVVEQQAALIALLTDKSEASKETSES